ncbi:MAG: hypothetical protein LBB63_02125 [Holosporaceae bacterium]|nr:hypothetical protein [Holosporaceae bacterium]
MYEYFVLAVEFMFCCGMFLNALLFIPQAIKIHRTKSALGLSPMMFVGFNIIQVFALLHGYIHRDYILMLGFALSLLFCGAVTFLIFLHR